MGNPDPMTNNEPTTTPHRLTDEQAGYGEPSEAALAFAEKVQHACLLDVNLHDLLQHDVARLLDEYAMEAVAAREAQYNALKAVADKMAVAIRSVKSDAVYDSAYEDSDGNEYPAYAVDSDYMNTLYQALREYEQVTDPAPKSQLPKCQSCKDSGYIWISETPDTGHDYQTNCPVCNPKIDLYAADRYESDF